MNEQMKQDLLFKAYAKFPGQIVMPLPHHKWDDCFTEYDDEMENTHYYHLDFHIVGEQSAHAVEIEVKL